MLATPSHTGRHGVRPSRDLMIGTSSHDRVARQAGAPVPRPRERPGAGEVAIRAARVRVLFQSPLPTLANLAVASLLGLVAWGHLPTAILAAWLATMAGVTAVRAGVWYSFSVRPVAAAD